MHAFDRQTDGQTDRRTEISSLRPRCIPCSAVKNVKSHVYLDSKKVKNVKKRTYSFTGLLITPAFNPPALSLLLKVVTTQVINKLENVAIVMHCNLRPADAEPVIFRFK